MKLRDISAGIIFIILIVLLFAIIVFGFIVELSPEPIPVEPIYSIYTYDYNTTIVYRYISHKLVYEYSYSGNHLVQIIEGSEQITIIEFDDQEQAKEFCYSYLDNIKMEDRL